MPETEDYTLSYDDAVAMLPDGDRVHTFVNPAGMLVGADWDREEILALLRAGKPEQSGEGDGDEARHRGVAWRHPRSPGRRVH